MATISPHVHHSALSALYIVLVVAIFFGTAHLLAGLHPDNRLSQVWVGLGF